jgi:exonuclease SbcC
MDSLNIHSFIELIRHNFKEYNFIISTHNDENAYFMKYKLEKLNRDVNIKNIQNEFFTDSDSNLK